MFSTMNSKSWHNKELQPVRSTGLDIGYVPAGPHAFLRLSGQFGPPQFIYHWPEGPVFLFCFFSASYAAIIFTGNRQNSEGNVNSYLFFVIWVIVRLSYKLAKFLSQPRTEII